ncbi:hypothetical protein Hanom_Chr09g00860591 [Helianthus anomalus]
MDPTHNTLPLSPSPSSRIGNPSPLSMFCRDLCWSAAVFAARQTSLPLDCRTHTVSPKVFLVVILYIIPIMFLNGVALWGREGAADPSNFSLSSGEYVVFV